MKKLVLIIGVTFLVVCAFGRVWTSIDGRKTEADLVSYDSATGELVLKRGGGKEFKINQSAFAEKDIVYLKEVETKRLMAEKIAVEQAANAAAEERKKAGTVVRYTMDGDHALSYHCYYPQGYSREQKHALLILFSPKGDGQQILKQFKKMGDNHNLIIIGCDGFKNGMDEDLGREWFDEMLPHIEKTIPHDANALYMGGMSGGAWRAYNYSAVYSDRPWMGILACGGWLGGSEYDGLKYRKKMAVAMVNGNNDESANAWIDHDTSELKSRRCKVKAFHFDGGHVIAPPDVLNEAMGWIIENRD